MSLYRKKPIIIEAFLLNERGLVAGDWFWDAVTRNDIITHCFGKHEPDPAWCEIKTLEGVMVAKAGDYIIRGVNDEIYPCKADIFAKTYMDANSVTEAQTVDAVTLPCKLGEKVYVIRKCSCYHLPEKGRRRCLGKVLIDDGGRGGKTKCGYIKEARFSLGHLLAVGKEVFLTREKAEAALADMMDGDGNG